MLTLSAAGSVILGAVVALVLAAGLIALYIGLRMRRDATHDRAVAARLEVLQATSPAAPMIVRADGRVECPQQLEDWLGLAMPPATLRDLSEGEHGLDSGSAQALNDAVRGAQRAARPFRVGVKAKESQRSLLAVGMRAPANLNAPGGVLVWFFDASEMQEELFTLREEVSGLGAAFDALRGLIEAAPLPMWYRDENLKLAMVNTAYVRAVEAEDAAQVIGRQIELVEDSGMGGPLANAAIARDSGQPQMSAVPATIGGARRMLKVHDIPLPDGGAAGFAIDVEELEQARAGIRRFADAQRALLDRLSAGVAQFGTDRGLRFCNEAFRRMFAMRPEWLSDRPEFDRILERMREANRLPEVRDFPGWKAERREWFQVADAEIEENWHLPGGTHLRVVAQPLPEGGLLLIFEDRTEQVQLASARDTLLRVRTATFDNLFEALGVFAADGRLQLWNNKFRLVWGFDEELLASHPRVDALAQAGAKKLANPDRASLIGALVRSATVERQQRGGRVAFADGRHFEFTAVPLPDGNALFTMLDISDSRRIEQALRDRNEALEAADRVKTAFVANMSYELRTPLTSIKGFAEMLHGGYAGELSDSGVEYSEAILESVARLSGLIDDVLDLTEGDDAKVAKKPVDLELTAHAAAEAVAGPARERGVDLAVEVLGSAGSVAGDQRRIRQAIEHLLRYSVGNLAKGKRVLLHVDGEKASARIVVSDDGPGMTRDRAKRAFDRFATGPGGGDSALGLDLPLAKRFVEAHGGSIDLITEPGEGTLITIELPRG
ncbi:PAS domain-containing sensor histidine kinase [Stakelama sediminis]|uniref:histidine kinase n=1 Tax=Stakelama sediminis TaxID=463200 RepID=A0A840Z2U9_9SPHN|nr:PAS domain-containing sensor histidine kinase [Stakelama sediminis]MBB5719992.1 signal transduction histidine kinase [Stakelama sediminis]